METNNTQTPETTTPKPVTLPALRFALLLAAGLVLTRLAWEYWPVLAAGIICFSLLFFLFRARPLGKLCGEAAFCLLVIACAFGLMRLNRQIKQVEFSQDFPLDSTVALQGRVDGPGWRVSGPSYDGVNRRRCVFRAEAFLAPGRQNWRSCESRLLLTLPDDPRIPLYGNERLGLVVRLKQPSGHANPGGFDYREYLLERSIVAEALVDDPADVYPLSPGKLKLLNYLDPAHWASSIRAKVFERHERLYSDQRVRAVASALMIGAREQLPRWVREDFIASGTMHLLVVSGLHVGFIAWALYLVLSLFLGRGWACSILVSIAVLVFALICGARPSVVRASLMCAFVLIALPLQRGRFLLNTLAAAFAVILLARPDWLADVGFQLSFAAVTGIGLLVPRMERIFQGRPWWGNRLARYPVQLALVSLTAQVAVTPLLAYYFLRVSPIALVANLLMVPLAGTAVILGFAADILVFISVPVAQVIAWLFDILTNILLYLASFFSSVPGACFDIRPPRLYDIALWWLAAFFAAAAITEIKHAARLGLVCLVWLNLYLWVPVIGSLNDELRVRFLDLGGKGNAVVLHFPRGKALLLDTGGGKFGIPTREVVIPYLARFCGSRIDWLVLRKCNRAGITACSLILDRAKVGSLIVPPVSSSAPVYRHFLERCLARGIAVRAPIAGDTLNLRHARLLSLGPGRYVYDFSGRLQNTSEANLLQIVEYKGGRILLAGAVDEPGLKAAYEYFGSPLECNVVEWPSRLKEEVVGRMLSKLVSSPGGLLTVITDAETYSNLKSLGWAQYAEGCRLRRFSTSVHGSIGLSFKRGRGLAVRTERGAENGELNKKKTYHEF